jgi:SAM-dependent methyltransferase
MTICTTRLRPRRMTAGNAGRQLGGPDAKESGPIRSPKRGAVGQKSRSQWFPYYAGFSSAFVEDVIEYLGLRAGATLLDPWLGAGTTAEVAAPRGYRVKGYDLNPAMLLVARARMLPNNTSSQLRALAESICQSYRRRIHLHRRSSRLPPDPLEQWLQPSSAYAFRVLEQSIAATVLREYGPVSFPVWRHIRHTPAILAFLYVVLFRTLRYFIADFRTSNPAWVKIPDPKYRLQLAPDTVHDRLAFELDTLLSALQAEPQAIPPVPQSKCVIACASSLRLPIANDAVDAVISSPPYCTRIDYVMATLPELAIIGYPNGPAIRRLRDSMIGTPTIAQPPSRDTPVWGKTCSRFLSAVSRHHSKASAGYYLKYYRQYFAGTYASLREIDRTLRPDGHCVLVVQDSFYKDIPNDLPQVIVEMGKAVGWHLKQRFDFHVKRTLAGVNPGTRQYRDRFHATESVLVLSKAQRLRV